MATIVEAIYSLEDLKGFLRLDKLPKLRIESPRALDDIWANGEYYPGCDKGAWNAGIYFILDAGLEVIYVGKASNNNSIGRRLDYYFETDPHNKKKWKLSSAGEQKFKHKPVPAAISVLVINDAQFAWLAPAIEEYLIKMLNPEANIVGKGDTDG
jgi:hypothetical protein